MVWVLSPRRRTHAMQNHAAPKLTGATTRVRSTACKVVPSKRDRSQYTARTAAWHDLAGGGAQRWIPLDPDRDRELDRELDLIQPRHPRPHPPKRLPPLP